MTQNNNRKFFDDFRPYKSDEIREAVIRLSQSDLFLKALTYFFPEKSFDELLRIMDRIETVYDFQANIMSPVIERILKTSSRGLSVQGLENLPKDRSTVFISNHRDIFLDAALHQYILLNNNFKTCEITFGDNLMQNPVVKDVGKINKMFKVYRSGKLRELMEKTRQLSLYINQTLKTKNESVWIAQRGGRTKDGNDKTQYSVLKMLTDAGSGSFPDRLIDLNIIPVTVSYEYEPNDCLKVRERFLSRKQPYKKAPGEDINSIIDGISMPKGKIHMCFGKTMKDEFKALKNLTSVNAQAKEAAQLIDRIMYKQFKLYPNHCIAADMLEPSSKLKDYYTPAQKEAFTDHMNKRLALIEAEDPKLRTLFLEIYAAPVYNKMQLPE